MDSVDEYSAGNEGFLDQVRKRHLENPGVGGKIRFVSGSWGSGKSHVLARIRAEAFGTNYLVSSVALSKDETPFNRFEEVFYRIVKEISSPEMARLDGPPLDAPLGEVFRRHLFGRRSGVAGNSEIDRPTYDAARAKLMANTEIDIDFRRLVCCYWETYLPEAGDPVAREDRRGTIMQWFAGEGTLAGFRKEFGVQKIIKRANSRVLLNSLCRFAVHTGFTGIVVLFDEAEMSYSVMQKSALKMAHNNLLHLINSIENSPGLFLIYATTPDFFTDEQHGIQIYGALAQRIGRPEDHSPRALERVWNLDYLEQTLDDYKVVARKIRDLYIRAELAFEHTLADDDELDRIVEGLHKRHPRHSGVGFWRVLVTAVTELLDRLVEESDMISVEELYNRTVDSLIDS